MSATGYLHPLYAASLAEDAAPQRLPRSGAWILRRPISECALEDAVGPYPILACVDWAGLPADLADLDGNLVSLSAVADPFGEHTDELLRESFPELVRLFKEHFVVDLERPLRESVSAHHRRNAAKGFAAVEVERVEDAQLHLGEWIQLYSTLVSRHRITGVADFSPESFASQLAVPGVTAFRAVRGGETVGMLLWYAMGDIAYYHLGAYSVTGYEHRASFALFWSALEHFAAEGLRWASLGAGAGIVSSPDDGLARFKEGWATGTRAAYFCGRIFDRSAYRDLVRERRAEESDYFPAYRAGHVMAEERRARPRVRPQVLATR